MSDYREFSPVTENGKLADCLKLATRIEELEIANARLRERVAEDGVRIALLSRCIVAADAFKVKVQAAESYCTSSGIYVVAAAHGVMYKGPTWVNELFAYEAAREEAWV